MNKTDCIEKKDDEKALKCLLFGLKQFYKHDKYLLNYNTSERSMVFKIAFYMLLWMTFNLSDYDLDVEYNRYSVKKVEKKDPHILETTISPKLMPEVLQSDSINNNKNKVIKEVLFSPDIIIHKRGKKDNLAVFEFKKPNASIKRMEIDRKKLKYLTSPREYNYNVGYLVILEQDLIKAIEFRQGLALDPPFIRYY